MPVLQGVSWVDGKCAMPTSCPVSECRSRTFAACRSHQLTETIDWQTIRYAMRGHAILHQYYHLCQSSGHLRAVSAMLHKTMFGEMRQVLTGWQ